MARYLILCLGIAVAALRSVEALTQDEVAKIEAGMLEHFQECNKEYGVSDEQLKAAKEDKNIDDIDPCLLSCVFKKAHFLNEQGVFDAEKVTELSKDYLKEEEDLSKVADIIQDCSSVNEEEVSDSEEGCERSKLLLSCFAKHKGELTTTQPTRR